MKKLVYLVTVLLLLTACKKSFTCECNGNKEITEIREENGSVFTDTITKTIFDSEVFRAKNENEAFAECSNKKNIILSDLTNSQTSVDVDCNLR